MTATLMIIGTIIAIFGTFGALSITQQKLDDHASFDAPTHNNTKKAIICISAMILGVGLLIAGGIMQQQKIQETSIQQTINQET